MRFVLPVLCSIAIVGCMANDTLGSSAVSQTNVNNLSRISVGMSQTEVRRIMRRPYSQETFFLDKDSYEVWFYVTQPTALGQSKMVTSNLTPITFKNGSLIAVGNDYYKWLVKQERIAAEGREVPSGTSDEDTGLEKALETPPDQKSAPAPKPPVQQPPPKQPPAKPTAPQKPGKQTSMSSRPKKTDASSDEEEDRGVRPLDKQDKDFLEEDSEQNFDFW